MFPKKFVEFFVRPVVAALESFYTPLPTLPPAEVPGWQPDRVYYGLLWLTDCNDEMLWARLRALLRSDRSAVSWHRKRESLRLLVDAVSTRDAAGYAPLSPVAWGLAPEQKLRGWTDPGVWQSELGAGK